MQADQQTTTEIGNILNRFRDAFSKRDMASLMSMVAPDQDVRFFGTGADEERVGPSQIQEQFQRDWDQSESASIDFDRLSISSHGPVAWAAGGVTLKAKASGQEMTFPGRITMVMEKRDGNWLIEHWHLSVPMAGQEQGRSFPS
jgi:ketosteroid isomerase-like protein